MTTSLAEFKKAVRRLEEALAKPKDEFLRDSVIQRFELSIELAWKTAKKVMGTNRSAPKLVVREMAENGLIENVELWLQSVDMRNLSTHTYREDLAEKVYGFAKAFLPELKDLLPKLEAK